MASKQPTRSASVDTGLGPVSRVCARQLVGSAFCLTIALGLIHSEAAYGKSACDDFATQATAYVNEGDKFINLTTPVDPATLNAFDDFYNRYTSYSVIVRTTLGSCPYAADFVQGALDWANKYNKYHGLLPDALNPQNVPGLATTTEALPMPCAGSPAQSAQTGLRTCAVVQPYIAGLVQQRGREMADTRYRGCDPASNTSAQVAAAACNPTVTPRVCNPFADEISGGAAETDTNHIGISCGNWLHFDTSLNGATCQVTPNSKGDYGTHEDSYMRGILVHSLQCYRNQVQTELVKDTLNLTKLTANPGPCLVMADTYKQQGQAVTAALTGMKVDFTTRLNLADINNCMDPVQLPDDKIGGNRQSACNLIAARQGLEATYAMLSACEVGYRAQLAFDQFTIGNADTGGFMTLVRNAINTDKCASKNSSDCSDGPVRDKCYLPKYTATLSSRASVIWNPSICGQPVNVPMPPMPSMTTTGSTSTKTPGALAGAP